MNSLSGGLWPPVRTDLPPEAGAGCRIARAEAVMPCRLGRSLAQVPQFRPKFGRFEHEWQGFSPLHFLQLELSWEFEMHPIEQDFLRFGRLGNAPASDTLAFVSSQDNIDHLDLGQFIKDLPRLVS